MPKTLYSYLGMLLLSGTHAALANTIYGTDGSHLWSIDPATGIGTNIGTFSTPDILSLAIDPATGVLYGTDSGSPNGTSLYTIDKTTGTTTAIGNTIVGPIAFNASGTLFAVSNGFLDTIDTASGNHSAVGALGTGLFFSSLTDSPGGVLYGVAVDAGSEELWTIDPATGAATLVTALTHAVNGIAFSPSGTLYASDSSGLNTLDPVNGSVTSIGGNFHLVDNIAYDSPADSTPEPASALLAISGALLMSLAAAGTHISGASKVSHRI